MTPVPRPAADETSPDLRPPAVLGVVLAGAAIEAAALTAGVVWALADLVSGRSEATAASVVLALFLLGVGAVVLAAARSLRRGARRARGVLVTWQLLQAATGLTLLGVADPPAALPWAAGGAVGVAVLVAGAALSPASLRFTAAHEPAAQD